MSWVLCSAHDKPVLRVLDTHSGRVLPVPSRFDGVHANFDIAVARSGWIAVVVGYEVVAFRDDDFGDPVPLPDAWEVFPGASPEALLVGRTFGSSREADEDLNVVLVDSSGRSLRDAEFPIEGLVGELARGVVVGRNGAWSWSGDPVPTPWDDATPIAVVGGHTVVGVTGEEAVAYDTRNGSSRRCRIPGDLIPIDFLGGTYNATGASYVSKPAGSSGFLVVQPDRGPRWCEAQADLTPVWLGDGKLLIDTSAILDLRTESLVPVPRNEHALRARVDVTGRFDPSALA